MKPGEFDYAVLIILLATRLFEWLSWPRSVRAIKAHVPGARGRAYRSTIVALWLATLCVLGLWVAKARPWSALWLGAAAPWRLGAGFLVAAIVVALLMLQMRKVQKGLTRPKALARLREQLAFADVLTPETSGERHGFWLLSITAGICEEIIFRGFMIWFIAAWTGLIAAIILSAILFGFEHIYLGMPHVAKAAMTGFVLALVVVASGSLWPAILIHIALDLNGGEIGFRVRQASVAISESAPSLTS